MRYDVPIFDPFRHRGDDFYHPGNEPAVCLIHIQYIYADISKLFEMLAHFQDKYERRLLSKYIVIEWISLDRFVQRLANLIIKGCLDFPATPEEIKAVKALYKDYRAVPKQRLYELKIIRDKMGAHRDPLKLIEIAKIWDSIDVQSILIVLKPIPPFFNYVKGLNIFTWVKSEKTDEGELFAFVQPLKIKKEEELGT